MIHLDRSYGGMPCASPKSEPIITFKDIKVGLDVVADKNRAPIPKGTKATVLKIEKDKVYLDTVSGVKELSQAELCLWFKPAINVRR